MPLREYERQRVIALHKHLNGPSPTELNCEGIFTTR